MNTRAEINNPSVVIIPETAVYPINAGIAPENPPKIIFVKLFLFKYAL